MAKQQQQIGGQEGGRWINRKPEPEELARWFAANVKMHEGLDHADYLAGITLIPNKEKVKTVVLGSGGQPQITDVEQMVWTPYPKVETREMYFWDYCDVNRFLGEIELVPAPAENSHLPAGFFHMRVEHGDGRTVTPFVGASYKVNIWRDHRRNSRVRIPPAGTKVVPLLRRGFNGMPTADENAILKAQTGAIGRALGFAGMLIVPGSGIATAEDMLEYLGSTPEPSLPAVAGPQPQNGEGAPDIGTLVRQQIAQLQSRFPQEFEEARAWATEKGFVLEEPPPDSLRSLERLLRRKLEAAEQYKAAAAAPEPS